MKRSTGMDKTSNTIETTATNEELALCRSILYDALSLGFRPPTHESVERLAKPEAAEALADAAFAIDSGHNLSQLARKLGQFDAPDALETIAKTFSYLFGHTARGEVPPYETEYGAASLFQQPQELSDISGFMRAFGLVMEKASHERIDHISCEFEFMCFLCRKEAYAIKNNDDAMLDVTSKAQSRFLRDHLGTFARAFACRIERADSDGFFGALGALCGAFIQSEAKRIGITLGPEHMQLRSTEEDNVPMACASCPQAPGNDTDPE